MLGPLGGGEGRRVHIRDLKRCRYDSGPFDARNWSAPLLAVGWLAWPFPFKRGDVSPEFVARLRSLVEDVPAGWGFRGLHGCSLCPSQDVLSHGIPGSQKNIFVPGQGAVYIAPGGIVHYVEAHSYLPPPEFTEAVLRCSDFESAEYRQAIREANAGVDPPFNMREDAAPGTWWEDLLRRLIGD